jgi:arsenate reductase (glutaredoxin)
MSEIAISNRQINLIYISGSVRAKKVLALARTKELPIREMNLMDSMLTEEQLAEIANSLQRPVSELVNQDHPYFREHFGHLELSEMDWLTLIKHHPQLLKQPIAMCGDKTILIETPTDILKL